MRAVGLGDLAAAAGALLAEAPARRPALAARLVAEARAAEVCRRASGRSHPVWGNGTLMAAALARPQAPLVPGDPAGLAALALVLAAVRAVPRRGRQRQA